MHMLGYTNTSENTGLWQLVSSAFYTIVNWQDNISKQVTILKWLPK